MVSIPKFKLTKATIKTEAELQEKLSQQESKFKYLNPGNHDVTILSATYEGAARDPNWGKFKLVLEGMGKRTTTSFLMVPIADVEYRNPDSGKVTTYLYTKFVQFMGALGVTVTIESLEDVLNSNFANPDKTLVGRTLTIDLGFDGNYVKYVGKDEANVPVLNIIMKDGSALADPKGKALVFSDRDAAMAHAEANQIKIQEYASVLEYSIPTGEKSLRASNW